MKYGLKRPRSTLGRSLRRAFTLTELLLAIMVVGILASMTIVVTTQAMYSAKVEKTKSTIAKLDVVISEMYENFETRRLPLSNLPTHNQMAHIVRLWYLRDLMRMEMPCSFDEITTLPLEFTFQYGGNNLNNTPIGLSDSPLRQLYANAISGNNGDYESAKCLYLIITLGNPESREAFHDSEITTDSDGLSYFVDGWGNPIGFLRWAPGLMDSDRQPIILDWSIDTDFQDADNDFSDPLNPLSVVGGITAPLTNRSCTVQVDRHWNNDNSRNNVLAWGLVPLVVSSGGEEDGYGLQRGYESNAQNMINVMIDPMYFSKNSVGLADSPSLGYKGDPANFNIITNHTSRR